MSKASPWQTVVDVDQLHQRWSAGEQPSAQRLVIVDCRFSLAEPNLGRDQFRQAHIPTAVYAHLDEDLSGTVVPQVTGRHPLPEIAEFAATLGAWGIDNQTQVVAYDSAGGAIAARLWWLLRWLGHEDVAVLDGGIAAWTAADLPLSDQQTKPRSRSFVAHPRAAMCVETEDVLAGGLTLVDSREAARYRGEHEPIDPVAGHIPGAVNRPFASNLENGHFRPPAELREEFQSLLGDASESAAFYCGSGVTAAHNLLAMAHAGLPPARLYNGSWSEWVADGKRPVATSQSHPDTEN